MISKLVQILNYSSRFLPHVEKKHIYLIYRTLRYNLELNRIGFTQYTICNSLIDLSLFFSNRW